jgi:hypothetical protein
MPGHRAFSLVGHQSSQPGGPSPAALRSRLRWAPEAAPPLTTADSSIARCDCRRSRQPSVGGEGPQRMIAPRRALSRQAEPTLVASPPIAVVVRERSSQSDPAPRILPRFWQNARDRQQNHQSQSSHECIEYRRYTSMRARCRADVDSARRRTLRQLVQIFSGPAKLRGHLERPAALRCAILRGKSNFVGEVTDQLS